MEAKTFGMLPHALPLVGQVGRGNLPQGVQAGGFGRRAC
jgi:hypothetical protein